MTRKERKLLRYQEVAEILGVPVGTVYSMKSRGTLPFIRLGGRLIRFASDDLERWLEEHSVTPSQK